MEFKFFHVLKIELDSVYMKALSKFQHRTLFSIIQRDFQVPYCSSSLLPKNYHDRLENSQNFLISYNFH